MLELLLPSIEDGQIGERMLQIGELEVHQRDFVTEVLELSDDILLRKLPVVYRLRNVSHGHRCRAFAHGSTPGLWIRNDRIHSVGMEKKRKMQKVRNKITILFIHAFPKW